MRRIIFLCPTLGPDVMSPEGWNTRGMPTVICEYAGVALAKVGNLDTIVDCIGTDDDFHIRATACAASVMLRISVVGGDTARALYFGMDAAAAAYARALCSSLRDLGLSAHAEPVMQFSANPAYATLRRATSPSVMVELPYQRDESGPDAWAAVTGAVLGLAVSTVEDAIRRLVCRGSSR